MASWIVIKLAAYCVQVINRPWPTIITRVPFVAHISWDSFYFDFSCCVVIFRVWIRIRWLIIVFLFVKFLGSLKHMVDFYILIWVVIGHYDIFSFLEIMLYWITLFFDLVWHSGGFTESKLISNILRPHKVMHLLLLVLHEYLFILNSLIYHWDIDIIIWIKVPSVSSGRSWPSKLLLLLLLVRPLVLEIIKQRAFITLSFLLANRKFFFVGVFEFYFAISRFSLILWLWVACFFFLNNLLHIPLFKLNQIWLLRLENWLFRWNPNSTWLCLGSSTVAGLLICHKFITICFYKFKENVWKGLKCHTNLVFRRLDRPVFLHFI